MKNFITKASLYFLIITLISCDQLVTDDEGKEVCMDDYIASVGKDRTNIESEAKNRGIEASALLLEIYNSATSVSDILFDCSATESYKELIDSTSGQFIKAKNPEIAIQEIVKYTSNLTQDSIDLVFLIDATGSMSDDINAVKNNLSMIIDSLHGKQVSISIAMYRDKNVDDIWYVRNAGNLIKPENAEISTFLAGIQAEGGGDFPESFYDAAYRTVSELNWHAKGRILVVLTDAGPLTGENTEYNINDVINICIEKIVVPLVILVGIS